MPEEGGRVRAERTLRCSPPGAAAPKASLHVGVTLSTSPCKDPRKTWVPESQSSHLLRRVWWNSAHVEMSREKEEGKVGRANKPSFSTPKYVPPIETLSEERLRLRHSPTSHPMPRILLNAPLRAPTTFALGPDSWVGDLPLTLQY